MLHLKKALRTVLVAAAILMPLFAFAPTVGAATQSSSAISQSYQTKSTDISQGVLVSLVSSGSNQVELATSSNATNVVGIAASKPLIELSSSGKGSVQVVVSGTTQVLVSDANGKVRPGDKITVSPLAGIGMKAMGAGEIVGVAQKPLASVKTVTEQAKGKDGQQIAVHVGLIPVAVNVGYYSAAGAQGSISAFVPPFLQNVANAVAGKQVSPLRVLVGTTALLLGFFAVVTMLYVGVRSGIISLGRNPLAADALRRGMIDILIAALGILVVTGVIVTAVVVA